MNKRMAPAVAALALAGLLVSLLAGPASAHEDKKVANFTFNVGFGTEPAYAGAPNSVQLLVHNNGKPVTDVKDLKVAVTTGDAEAMQLTLAPNFEVGEWGEPGDYRAFFIPTTPGRYTFHFTGKIQGKKIDRSFTSIKDGFDAVDDPAEVQYPVKDPTGAQLATRVDREAARLNASLTSLTAERDQARDDAAGARRLATIALIVGAAGLLGAVVVSGLALRRQH
jgi:hypothetical protein